MAVSVGSCTNIIFSPGVSMLAWNRPDLAEGVPCLPCLPCSFEILQSRSQYVHHFCDGFKTSINHSSSPRLVEIPNSSVLERGAAPQSIADEFLISTGPGDELWLIKVLKPSQK